MAELFGTTRNNITMHLTNILEEELKENSVYKEFLHTAEDGKNYKTKYYNLDAIIAVGFKVNSKRAIEFRLWAINILKQYSIKGYVLDNDMPYYMWGLKNYKEDKMFLIDTIRYEQDLYGNIVNEMLDFDLGDK
ncbi:MAG: RhuM family protein [Bacilli bacterium]